MHVILGADHGGFQLKEKIKSWLGSKGFEVIDVGAITLVPDDDYVDFAKAAVKEATSSDDRIILFCRNGLGMSIVANRFAGVRCGVAFDEGAVQRGRTDDDINCLSIPADYTDEEKVKRMIDAFLNEKFSGDERYARRVMKLESITL
jgi:ribose 5-phosphate isomerase B